MMPRRFRVPRLAFIIGTAAVAAQLSDAGEADLPSIQCVIAAIRIGYLP
jgi:hypothetical protein